MYASVPGGPDSALYRQIEQALRGRPVTIDHTALSVTRRRNVVAHLRSFAADAGGAAPAFRKLADEIEAG